MRATNMKLVRWGGGGGVRGASSVSSFTKDRVGDRTKVLTSLD